jgi:hypothetical protein
MGDAVVMSDQALVELWKRADETYFRRYPDRRYHIRNAYKGECELEFRSIGGHDLTRRRIILTRVDALQQPIADNKVLKIPFLAFADESIEDTDDTLYPIMRDLMADALKDHPDILAEMKRRSN